ncbi:MAG: hypothetical protein QXL96_03295 [Ignisphaera sp.]
MHRCLSYSSSGVRNFGEEYPWYLVLYIEINLGKNKEVVICNHPTYVMVDDLQGLAKSIYNIECSELECALEISKILDTLVTDWRKEFEVVIRKYFIAVSIYL